MGRLDGPHEYAHTAAMIAPRRAPDLPAPTTIADLCDPCCAIGNSVAADPKTLVQLRPRPPDTSNRRARVDRCVSMYSFCSVSSRAAALRVRLDPRRTSLEVTLGQLGCAQENRRRRDRAVRCEGSKARV